MRNLESVISSHNKQVLNPSKEYFGCNCRVIDKCPLGSKCLTPDIVYEAKNVYEASKTNNESKRYLGASVTPFKERLRSHTKRMRSALNFQNVFGRENLMV